MENQSENLIAKEVFNKLKIEVPKAVNSVLTDKVKVIEGTPPGTSFQIKAKGFAFIFSIEPDPPRIICSSKLDRNETPLPQITFDEVYSNFWKADDVIEILCKAGADDIRKYTFEEIKARLSERLFNF